jgi:hypothetical protein
VLSRSGIVRPILFDTTKAVNNYLHVLQEEFLHFLQEMGVNFKETFFQEDGAWPHTVNAVLDVLNEHYDDKALSDCFLERSGMSGPGHHLLDLNQCDYVLWGFLRDRFPMRSLDFSIDLILPAVPQPWDKLSR